MFGFIKGIFGKKEKTVTAPVTQNTQTVEDVSAEKKEEAVVSADASAAGDREAVLDTEVSDNGTPEAAARGERTLDEAAKGERTLDEAARGEITPEATTGGEDMSDVSSDREAASEAAVAGETASDSDDEMDSSTVPEELSSEQRFEEMVQKLREQVNREYEEAKAAFAEDTDDEDEIAAAEKQNVREIDEILERIGNDEARQAESEETSVEPLMEGIPAISEEESEEMPVTSEESEAEEDAMVSEEEEAAVLEEPETEELEAAPLSEHSEADSQEDAAEIVELDIVDVEAGDVTGNVPEGSLLSEIEGLYKKAVHLEQMIKAREAEATRLQQVIEERQAEADRLEAVLVDRKSRLGELVLLEEEERAKIAAKEAAQIDDIEQQMNTSMSALQESMEALKRDMEQRLKEIREGR